MASSPPISLTEISEVVQARLGTWGTHLISARATPFLLAGFTTAGKMIVLTCADIPPDHIEGMLRDALGLLEQQRRDRN